MSLLATKWAFIFIYLLQNYSLSHWQRKYVLSLILYQLEITVKIVTVLFVIQTEFSVKWIHKKSFSKLHLNMGLNHFSLINDKNESRMK